MLTKSDTILKYFCDTQLIFIAILVLACSFCPASFSASSQSLAFLYHGPNHDHYKFSPGGSYLAYHEIIGNKSKIGLINLNSNETKKLVFRKSIEIGSMVWLDEKRLLIEISGSLATLDVQDAKIRPLVEKSGDFFYWLKDAIKHFRYWRFVHLLPEDPEHVLMASPDPYGYETLYKINIENGEEEQLVRGRYRNIHHWFVDAKGQPSLGIRRKKGGIEILLANSRGKLRKSELKINGKSYKLGFKGASLLDQRVVVYDAPETNTVYLAENVVTDRFRLVSYDLKEQSIVKVIHKDDKYDVGGQFTDTALIYDNNDIDIAGIYYETNRPKMLWIDPVLSELQQKLENKYPEMLIQIVRWTPDKNIFLAAVSSDENPGKIILYNRSSLQETIVSDYSQAIVNGGYARTFHKEIEMRDGQVIDAYVSYPIEGGDPKNIPFIVLPHGGPWARDVSGYEADVHYLAAKGFGVLRLNYRGSAGYGRRFLLAGIRNLSDLMIDDIADGTNWLVENKLADPERIYIFGSSYGGYAALMAAYKYPELYSAAASEVAPIDWPLMFETYREEDNEFGLDYWRHAIGDPEKEMERLRQESPLHIMDNIKQPVLAVFGQHDQAVPVSQAHAFESAMKDLKKENLYFKLYSNEGHGLFLISNRVELMEMITELFSSGGISHWGYEQLKTKSNSIKKVVAGLTHEVSCPTVNTDGKNVVEQEGIATKIWYDPMQWEVSGTNSEDSNLKVGIRLLGVNTDVKLADIQSNNLKIDVIIENWLQSIGKRNRHLKFVGVKKLLCGDKDYFLVEAYADGSLHRRKYYGYFHLYDDRLMMLSINMLQNDYELYSSLVDELIFGAVVSPPNP